MDKRYPQIKETPPQRATVLLPKELVVAAEQANLSKRNHKHLLRLIAICWYRYLVLAQTEEDYYAEFSKEFIKKVTSGKFYQNEFTSLKQDPKDSSTNKNIIFQSNGSYDVKRHKAKRYRLNPKLLRGTLVPVEADLFLEENSLNSIFPEVIHHFDQSLHSLHIDHQHAKRELQDIISPILITKNGYSMIARTVAAARDLQDEEQPIVRCDRIVLPKGTFHAKGWSLSLLLNKLSEEKEENEDAQLLIDGKTAYIGGFQAYFERKRRYMIRSAEYNIDSIQSGATYRNMSSTNGRLHSSLSNMHSALLPFLTLEEEHLAAWDLRSSQPCILANLLCGNELFLNSLGESKYPKLSKWVKAISKHTDKAVWGTFLHGLLTEDIYGKISAENDHPRSWAKGEFMTLLFSHYQFNSPISPLLNQHYPGLNESLRAVQKTCIEELEVPLAVVLQTTEAHVFLENILRRIAAIELPAFTRHDSILFAGTQERSERVKGIIDEVFEKLGFRGEMKFSSYSILDTDDPLFYSPDGNDYYVAHRFLEDESDFNFEIQQHLMGAEIGEFSSTDFDWSKFKSPS